MWAANKIERWNLENEILDVGEKTIKKLLNYENIKKNYKSINNWIY